MLPKEPLLICYRIAAAAAKINAQIQAKKGIQHVDVPPIQSTLNTGSASPAPPGVLNSASTVNGEMYIADGDYIRDIEVNDLRNRYTLTKGSTQKMVNTPCVNIPLIPPGFFHLASKKPPPPLSLSILKGLWVLVPYPFLCRDVQAYLKRDS